MHEIILIVYFTVADSCCATLHCMVEMLAAAHPLRWQARLLSRRRKTVLPLFFCGLVMCWCTVLLAAAAQLNAKSISCKGRRSCAGLMQADGGPSCVCTRRNALH